MTEVISVRFKSKGKVYFFDPAGISVASGQSVVVETSKGLEKIKDNVELNSATQPPKWLEFDANNMIAKVVANPAREDIDLPIEEHLIVELYSK